jgi:hypothetical protein
MWWLDELVRHPVIREAVALRHLWLLTMTPDD